MHDRTDTTPDRPAAPPAPPVRPEPKPVTFTDFLRTVQDGAFEEELAERLADLVKDMREAATVAGGKPKARLTITLDLKLEGGVFEVVPDATVKVPKRARLRSIMYEGTGGMLVPNNPRQYALALEAPPRDVTTPGDRSQIRAVE